MIAVLERDGPIEPVADGLGAAQSVRGLVLQEGELLGGQIEGEFYARMWRMAQADSFAPAMG